MRRFLEWLSKYLGTPNVIYDREGQSPYLTRWYLLGRRTSEQGKSLRKRYLNFFLHRFHRSDMDTALHSHPWRWGLSLVLCGGYDEERLGADGTVVRRRRRPGTLNLIRRDTFHRVELLDGEAWTLFIAGPVHGSWSFFDRTTGATYPWREFIARVQAPHEQ